MKILLKILLPKLIHFLAIILPKNKRRILIIKPDAIGDYILFRNFIQSYSECFPNNEIILLGNETYRDICITFDSNWINKSVWINRNEFLEKLSYFYLILLKLVLLRPGSIIYPVYSRELKFDLITYFLHPHKSITFKGDAINTHLELKIKYDKYYTDLISVEDFSFEFARYKSFFNQIVNSEKINKLPVSLNFHLKQSRRNILIFFPGAGSVRREWHTINFIKLGKVLAPKFDNIYIAGSKSDNKKGIEIINGIDSENVINICGEYSLSQIIKLVAEAKLVISNESSPVHIAAATQTKCICISNANHYGRFNPYPKDIAENIYTVYPDVFDEEVSNSPHHIIMKKYEVLSLLDINQIKPDKILDLIRRNNLV